MANVMLKLRDDQFLIAHDAHEEVADRQDTDYSLLSARRQGVPVRGMSSRSAAQPIAIRVLWEPYVQRLMTASGPSPKTVAAQQVGPPLGVRQQQASELKASLSPCL